jgi:hypothetical protein
MGRLFRFAHQRKESAFSFKTNCNQIARDDKENINAHEPARAKTSQNMEKHNRQNGKGTDTIDMWIIFAVDDLRGMVGVIKTRHR